VPELDEHQVDRLIKATMSDVAREFPEIGKLHENYRAAEAPHDKHRTFQLMFEQMVMLWVAGKVSAAGIETWPEFGRRVRDGFKRMLDGEGRGRSIAAFTSVGAVTVCLQAALGCGDRQAFDLGWRLRNCSITEFVFTRGRVTLEGFNAYPHLEDPALWTYR
jgi:broad specificity phosphatase PhoE